MKNTKKAFCLILCILSASLAYSRSWKKNKSEFDPSLENRVHNLIIIGGGPAGLTASIYAARAKLQPLLLEGSNPGGQLMGTTYIENWPGEKKILGSKLMMNLREHAQSFGTQCLTEKVVAVDFSQKPFTLLTEKNKQLKAHCVIIATGTRPNQLHCLGEEDYWGKGVATCTLCDGPLYYNKKVMIIGGGDTAIYYALSLKKFTKKITLIQNQDQLTASLSMQQKILNDPDISIIYNSKITEIKGNGEYVTDVTIVNEKTGEQKDMPVDGIFVATGKRPNTETFKNQLELNDAGYIIVKNYTHTSVPGVFSAGDLQDYHYKQAVIMAGAGCMAAIDAQRYLEKILNE
ncbi:MAG: thioredoxin-disulfide reductase [bacterium]|nr:thioredoxin-disulfide reductase [bacterium]